MWGPEGWGLPEGWSPELWSPELWSCPEGWGAQNFAPFFPPLPPLFSFFLPLFGSFRGILLVFLKARTLKCAQAPPSRIVVSRKEHFVPEKWYPRRTLLLKSGTSSWMYDRGLVVMWYDIPQWGCLGLRLTSLPVRSPAPSYERDCCSTCRDPQLLEGPPSVLHWSMAGARTHQLAGKVSWSASHG